MPQTVTVNRAAHQRDMADVHECVMRLVLYDTSLLNCTPKLLISHRDQEGVFVRVFWSRHFALCTLHIL